MLKQNFKKQALTMSAATLALVASQSASAAFVLVPNGDFAAGGADWGLYEATPGEVSFPAAGGNGGGYGLVSTSGGSWGGGLVGGDAVPLSLADYGKVAGDTLDFQFDMKDFDGVFAGETAIKVESWSGGAQIAGSEIQVNYSTAGSTDWNTYTHSYTTVAGADSFKVVLVGTNMGEGNQLGFDNVYIDSSAPPEVPVPAAVWLFGSGLLGLVGVARRKRA